MCEEEDLCGVGDKGGLQVGKGFVKFQFELN